MPDDDDAHTLSYHTVHGPAGASSGAVANSAAVAACMQSRSRGYEGDVGLRVARGSRWLVMSDVKVALDDAADG
jgi:hypothetical protein